MRNNPRSFFQSILNTLDLLTSNGLTIFHNSPVYRLRDGCINITWPNHISGRFNCEPNFGKITQYLNIVESCAYTCLLFDGSMIRAAYTFQDNLLLRHSLLWWPSPFPLDLSDLELGGVLDIFGLYANSRDWHEQIQMRSPLRFDFDIDNVKIGHPASHLHMQIGKCRLFVDSPVCFNKFIKFIFKNFYPDEYGLYLFWDDLDNTELYYDQHKNNIFPDSELFSWVKHA